VHYGLVKKLLTLVLALLLGVFVVPNSMASGVTAGSACAHAGAKALAKGKPVICVLSRGSLRWTTDRSNTFTASSGSVQNIYENKECPNFEEGSAFKGHSSSGTVMLICKKNRGVFTWVRQSSLKAKATNSTATQNVSENQNCTSFEENLTVIGRGAHGATKLTCRNFKGKYVWSSKSVGESTSTPTPAPIPTIDPVQPVVSQSPQPIIVPTPRSTPSPTINPCSPPFGAQLAQRQIRTGQSGLNFMVLNDSTCTVQGYLYGSILCSGNGVQQNLAVQVPLTLSPKSSASLQANRDFLLTGVQCRMVTGGSSVLNFNDNLSFVVVSTS